MSTAGIDFIGDLIKHLKDEWKPDNTDGKKPEMVKSWEVKEAGHGDSNYSKIVFQLDGENPQIFSLMQLDDDEEAFWDWLHTTTVTIDIRTGISELHALKVSDEVIRILKKSAFGTIGDNYYIQMLPGPITVAHEQYRNLYRVLIDCDSLRFNP